MIGGDPIYRDVDIATFNLKKSIFRPASHRRLEVGRKMPG
jgi:hypothetical protein